MAIIAFCNPLQFRFRTATTHHHADRIERPGVIRRHGVVYMKKGKKSGSSGNRGKATTGFSKEQQERLRKVSEQYGVTPLKPGDKLDRQFTSKKSREDDAKQQEREQALYRGLVNTFGQNTLDQIESATYVILGTLLLGFLGSGLAIASEAFFKASRKEIPEGLDNFVLTVEQWFTPILILFLILSSILGVYKQAQLNAGAAQYDESKGGKRN